MVDQPVRFRRASWSAAAYLLLSIVLLCMIVTFGMNYVPGTGSFNTPLWTGICFLGILIGVVGAGILGLKARASNSNLRAAILSLLFGSVFFALGAWSATAHGRDDRSIPHHPAVRG